jgi:hypothetical protein
MTADTSRHQCWVILDADRGSMFDGNGFSGCQVAGWCWWQYGHGCSCQGPPSRREARDRPFDIFRVAKSGAVLGDAASRKVLLAPTRANSKDAKHLESILIE